MRVSIKSMANDIGKRAMGIASILTGVLYLSTTLAFGATAVEKSVKTSVEQVSSAKIFTQPLVWAGIDQPNAQHADDLLVTIGMFKDRGVDGGVESLENFLRAQPKSGWAPSLHAHLGKFYRDRGRYTLALEHWEKAWAATKDAKDYNSKSIADFTLAHWTKLLASLGRKDELTQIIESTKNRTLSAIHLQDAFNATKQAHKEMLMEPGNAYKCGTFALFNIYQLQSNEKVKSRDILKIASPDGGFSLDALQQIATKQKLDLVPVFREGTTEIVVPSVVHWKQNHYAAIIAKNGNLYKVIDPTFGNTMWMKASVLNEEASGYFMVPEKEVKQGWRKLDAKETSSIKGKGITPTFVDIYDCCGNYVGSFPIGNANESDPSTWGQNDQSNQGGGCIPGSPICGGSAPGANSGGDNGGTANGGWPSMPPSPCTGTCGSDVDASGIPASVAMPSWQVSQPNMNLWLHDTPMYYRTAFGRTVSLNLHYKQRGMVPFETNRFSFGQGWSAALSAYMVVTELDSDPDFANYDATVYGRSGGQLHFTFDDTNPNQYNKSKFERILDGGGHITGFKLKYRDGSEDIFGYLVDTAVGEVTAYVTEHKSAQNRVSRWNYATNSSILQLTGMVDEMGQTNTFRYKTNALWLIEEVENPFGSKVQLRYNGSGYLTNITDVINISSSFGYDSDGAVTNLTTPYGTTTFTHHKSLFTMPNDSEFRVYRALEITGPNGAKYAWIYRQLFRIDHPLLDPINTPWFQQNEEFGWYLLTTTFWGPRQVANWSTSNITNLTKFDVMKGGTIIWRGQIEEPVSKPSLIPCAYRAPSQDGVTEGQKYYLEHPDAYLDQVGSSSLPSRGWYLLPDGTTNSISYTYNSLGRPTKIISTYSINGTIGLRTNQFEYDASGIDLIKVIGPTGNIEAGYNYDTNHLVIAYTNKAGYVTTYTYNTNLQLATISSPSGLTSTNIYDGNGWLIKTIALEIGKTNSFTWTNGLIYSHNNECGLAITNTYDNLNRLTSVKFPDGTTTSNLYSRLDLVGVKDRLGNWTYRGYNALGRVTSVTNALGDVTRYGYCSCGTLESVTNALGQVILNIYNNAGQKTAIIDEATNITVYSYDKLGRLITITDPVGNSTTNYYNNQSLIVSVSNALGRVRSRAYNVDDLATNIVDANGVSISIIYDDSRRVVRRIYPDLGEEQFEYSPRGLIKYTNQLNEVTSYGYDNARRLIAVTNANNYCTYFTYDASGKMLSLKDGKGQTTKWNYDEFCRLTNKVDAQTNIIFYCKYDSNGQVTNKWTPAKGSIFYSYNALGSLTNIDYPVSADIQIQYDALQRITNMVDASGVTAYSYSQNGHIQCEDGPWENDTITYSYNANQLREGVSLLGPNGKAWTQSYLYDQGNRLKETTSSSGLFEYEYKTGNSLLVHKIEMPGGSRVVNEFDTSGRLTNTQLQNSSTNILNLHSYVYNKANQRIKQVFTESNYVDYAYNSIGQLISAKGYEPDGSTLRIHEQNGYSYDASGNLISRTNNALIQDLSVDVLNQITDINLAGSYTVAGNVRQGVSPITVSVNGLTAEVYSDKSFAKSGFVLTNGINVYTAIASDSSSQFSTNTVETYSLNTTPYRFDDNGNLISDGYRSFSYDDENQLTTIFATNAWKSEFIYDGLMRRRIRKEYSWSGSSWEKTNEVRYLYVRDLVIQERNDSNAPLVTYTRGNDFSGSVGGGGGIGGLLARTSHPLFNQQPSVSAFYHSDANGNITAIVNSQQAIVARYGYDSYGNVTKKSGVLCEDNLYRFSTKEAHPVSGMSYFLFRYYAPSIQRWLNRDLIEEEGGLNLYTYVENSPVNFMDPYGLTLADDVNAAKNAADAAKKAWQAAQEFLKTCKDPREAELAREQAVKLLDDYYLKNGRFKELNELLRARNMGGFVNPRLLIRGGAVVGAGVAGYAGGRALGRSTPYPGGGTIDENIQEVFFNPFWDRWYQTPDACNCRK